MPPDTAKMRKHGDDQDSGLPPYVPKMRGMGPDLPLYVGGTFGCQAACLKSWNFLRFPNSKNVPAFKAKLLVFHCISGFHLLE